MGGRALIPSTATRVCAKAVIRELYAKRVCFINEENDFCVTVFFNLDIKECEFVSCRNGGTCVDEVARYMCQCMLGYTGVDCETGKIFFQYVYFSMPGTFSLD